MFRKNEETPTAKPLQWIVLLPDRLPNKLLTPRATTFYRKLSCPTDKTVFVPSCSEEASRPSFPVNLLIGLEILKSGCGWRNALGLNDLCSDILTPRTLCNFRRRVREHARHTKFNLIGKVSQQVTDDWS